VSVSSWEQRLSYQEKGSGHSSSAAGQVGAGPGGKGWSWNAAGAHGGVPASARCPAALSHPALPLSLVRVTPLHPAAPAPGTHLKTLWRFGFQDPIRKTQHFMYFRRHFFLGVLERKQ